MKSINSNKCHWREAVSGSLVQPVVDESLIPYAAEDRDYRCQTKYFCWSGCWKHVEQGAKYDFEVAF